MSASARGMPHVKQVAEGLQAAHPPVQVAGGCSPDAAQHSWTQGVQRQLEGGIKTNYLLQSTMKIAYVAL
jgi:hypothetical protein